MSDNFSSVPIWEIAAEMIYRVILCMKDWLSNAARVQLWSLSGSPPSSSLSSLSALRRCFFVLDVFGVWPAA